MLGFSVSLGSKLNQSYIQSMVSQGYDTIFTSLQIPEEDDQLTLIHFGELCQILSQYSITFIIDVNPSLLNHHFYSLLDQYAHGDFVIRIDHDLNINLIHDIQQHGYRCCINASTITQSELSTLYRHSNIQSLVYCHNYYPRPDTGLSATFVEQQNALIHSFDSMAYIYAFIPGTELRGPIFKGLPTIEVHRNQHPCFAVHELERVGISNIIIGDTRFDLNLARQLYQMCVQRHFELRVNVTENINDDLSNILFTKHHSRIDSPEHIIRSYESRHLINQTIEAVGIDQRLPGDITIDNHLNGRYEGELQVIKSPLQGHPNINRIARIYKQDQPFIHLIAPGDTFEFKCLKEQ